MTKEFDALMEIKALPEPAQMCISYLESAIGAFDVRLARWNSDKAADIWENMSQECRNIVITYIEKYNPEFVRNLQNIVAMNSTTKE